MPLTNETLQSLNMTIPHEPCPSSLVAPALSCDAASRHRAAAIDAQFLTGDECTFPTGEKQHGVCDLGNLDPSCFWNDLHEGLRQHGIGFQGVPMTRGVYDARRNRVHGDIVL